VAERDEEHVTRQLAIAEALGFPMAPGAIYLDFGGGEGEVVQAATSRGLDAWGCDIVLDEPSDRLRKIRMPYTIPFPDDMFDMVGSNQVFEHVQNPQEALLEIHRVLKPGGISLHVFPSRYRVIEGHTFVPLASVIHARWWLRLWAQAGIRNQFQQGKSAAEVVDLNHPFLLANTRYLRRREIFAYAGEHFPTVKLVEADSIRLGRRAHLADVPGMARLYSGLRSRVLFLQKAHY
jgi:SAM-dependent methyltransferase